jgi:type I restriction enzyme, S subunit
MALSRKPIEIVNEGNHQLLVKAKHWERLYLGDIAIIQNGFAFKSELFSLTEGIQLIRIRDIESQKTENRYTGTFSKEYIVLKGDMLIGMDGDFKVAIWKGEESLLNQRVCRVNLTSNLYSGKFLFYVLQPYLDAIHAETSSVTVKHLSSKTISEIPLPLPSLNEQNRIVAKIEELFSELDQGIDNLKTAQAQLKVYRQALLKHAFEGKLTAEWRAQNADKLESASALQQRIQDAREQRYEQQLAEWQANGKQSSKPKSPKPITPLTKEELAELAELPEGWGLVRLGDIVDTNVGFAFKSNEFTDSGVRLLRGENIEPGQLRWTETRFFPNSRIQEFSELIVNAGEIIIAMDRPVISSGLKVARVKKADIPCLLVQRVARIKERKEISTNYVLYVIEQNRFINHCLGKQTGTQLPHIS